MIEYLADWRAFKEEKMRVSNLRKAWKTEIA
jgi:hypothetical protein